MAHESLTVAGLRATLLSFAVLGAIGCGGTAAPPPAHPEAAKPFSTLDSAWGRFHSNRFLLSLPLPEGKAWRIDDHKTAALVATHPPTRSTVTVRSLLSSELMNRGKCEDLAREIGDLPANANFNPIDDQVVSQPAGFDSRTWIAIEVPSPAHKTWVGHAYLFAAQLHRCLLVHFSTEIALETEQDALMSRLIMAQTKLFPRIAVDGTRTAADANIPRAKDRR